jgi:hypothetical protein
MKKIKFIIPFVSLVFLMSACTEDFLEMNTDPNSPVDVPLANHLAGAMISFDGGSLVMTNSNPWMISSRYFAQRWGAAYNPDVSNTFSNLTSSNWGGYYAALADLNFIIASATEAEAYNMVAAALTYKAEITQIYTDRYGEMPYTEAAKAAEDVLRPAYDSQPSIYAAIISDLKTAADYFNAGHSDDIGSVEPFYNGDVSQWQKLCNSLRLRVAARISNVDQPGAEAIISEVLGNPSTYPVMETWEDAAEITYGGQGTNYTIGYWYWNNLLWHSGPTFYLVDMLEDNNDPRLGRIIGVAPEPGPEGEYNGTTEIGRHPDFSIPEMSYFNENYYVVDNTTGPNIHYRNSELDFLMAEFLVRGLTSGGDAAAQQAYEDGIYSSMKEMSIMVQSDPDALFYGASQIDDADIAAYLLEPFVAWGGTDQEKLEKIWIQKWIAMCFMQNEPWAEMRRNDVPNWGIARGSYYDGHNRDPFRLPYPSDEELMNSENSAPYFESMYAGDYLWGGQLWWDTRTGVQ